MKTPINIHESNSAWWNLSPSPSAQVPPSQGGLQRHRRHGRSRTRRTRHRGSAALASLAAGIVPGHHGTNLGKSDYLEILITHRIHVCYIYGNIYHQYTPNVSIYTIHGSYGSWVHNDYPLASGNRLHNYGKITIFNGQINYFNGHFQ